MFMSENEDIIFILEEPVVIMVLKFIGTPTSIVLAIILWTLSLSLFFYHWRNYFIYSQFSIVNS